MASRLLLLSATLMMLGVFTLSQAVRIGPKRCCFSFLERPVPLNLLVNFSLTSQQCPTTAVLFRTVKGRYLCARPGDPWVEEHKKSLEQKAGGRGAL